MHQGLSPFSFPLFKILLVFLIIRTGLSGVGVRQKVLIHRYAYCKRHFLKCLEIFDSCKVSSDKKKQCSVRGNIEAEKKSTGSG